MLVHRTIEKKSFGNLTLLLCKIRAIICYCFVHQHGRLITWLKTIYRNQVETYQCEKFGYDVIVRLSAHSDCQRGLEKLQGRGRGNPSHAACVCPGKKWTSLRTGNQWSSSSKKTLKFLLFGLATKKNLERYITYYYWQLKRCVIL